MSSPTLTVVMPNYNHAQYLSESLEAILAQSYRPQEIIVLDDASTDNSVEVIERYANKEPTIQLIKAEVNQGVIPQLNRLLKIAKGDFFYAAAADDKILPGFLERTMQMFEAHPEAGLCSTRAIFIDADGRNLGPLHQPLVSKKSCFIPPQQVMSLLRKHCSWIQGNATVYRKRTLVDSGGYIPELHAFCDGFIVQVIAARYGACFIPEPLAAWRQLKTSYSVMNAIREDSHQDIHLAADLMRSNFGDSFSSDFIELWEKRELINNRLGRLQIVQNNAIDDLKSLMPNSRGLDRGLFRLRQSCTKLEYYLLKAYLYMRLGIPSKSLYLEQARRLLFPKGR